MIESQKRAFEKYKQKRIDEGNPIKYKLKYVTCNICNKQYLNSNKSHHYNTKFHLSKL